MPPTAPEPGTILGSAEQTELTARLKREFDLLSPSDLAALRGVDERTLTVERSQGRGPDYVKLGRTVYYRGSDIRNWIELNVQATDRTHH
jgi:hypothetical protein